LPSPRRTNLSPPRNGILIACLPLVLLS
jgi:hypothetical protein